MLKKLIFFISSLFEKLHLPDDIIAMRYVVIKHLGSGSYGHSYLVFDRTNKEQCVLKTLRWHKRVTKSGQKEFVQEVEILKNICHPGVPSYFESGMDELTPFYTMEFIKGHTFEQLIFREGKMYSEVECFILAKKLLETIDYLHQNQLVHRDIRIPNIMLEGDKLRIIDLGLARHVGTEINSLQTHPRKQISVQSDFYGLGHFILFLLYSSYTPEKKAKERSWEEELTISDAAKNIIRRLLQIDEPYRDCLEIHQDFQHVIKTYDGERVKVNGFF
jgi:serine/threonine protein kinase